MSSPLDIAQQKAAEVAAITAEYKTTFDDLAARTAALQSNLTSPDAQASASAISEENKAAFDAYRNKVLPLNTEIFNLSKANPSDGILKDSSVLGAQRAADDTLVQSQVVDRNISGVNSRISTAADPTTTVKTPSSTNSSKTDEASVEQMQSSDVVSSAGAVTNESSVLAEARVKDFGQSPQRLPAGIMLGAERKIIPPAVATVTSANGITAKPDLRVKIRVPRTYLDNQARGSEEGELTRLDGIIFPYTPTINYDTKADYSAVNPTHSNYTQYFYQHSSISPISISGKFTVQNETDAQVYLATIHLLRALTKMHTGADSDRLRGSPPPICRLDAYGLYMLHNVPVAINSFRIDLPDSVDYFRLGGDPASTYKSAYGSALVPVVSTISVTCYPMYSRNEMQNFSVSGWLAADSNKKSGYL